MFRSDKRLNCILAIGMSISLLLGGCGSSPDLKASSISEGGGVIDASGKVVSGDSSDSEKAGSSGKKKKLKKKAGSNSDNSDSSGSPEAAPAAGGEETSDTVSDTAAKKYPKMRRMTGRDRGITLP